MRTFKGEVESEGSCLYHPSSKRLDERIKPHLYDLGIENKSVSAAGFVALNGRNCYAGVSFGGVNLVLPTEAKYQHKSVTDVPVHTQEAKEKADSDLAEGVENLPPQWTLCNSTIPLTVRNLLFSWGPHSMAINTIE